MNKVIRKTTGTVFGLMLAILSGAPAIADDTELLLVAPPDPTQVKPNVMFILDTSGSMNTVQATRQSFDPITDYSEFGTCDKDSLYYTTDSLDPVCDPANTSFVDKSAYFCDASSIEIAGVGQYAGVLVQYRAGASDTDEWLELEPGNDSDAVECEADSGIHGDGRVAEVYAASGAGLSDPWTSDPSQVLAWGSSGRNVTYTIFDGNYLNYQNDPTTQDMTRSDIMKLVTKKVLN